MNDRAAERPEAPSTGREDAPPPAREGHGASAVAFRLAGLDGTAVGRYLTSHIVVVI